MQKILFKWNLSCLIWFIISLQFTYQESLKIFFHITSSSIIYFIGYQIFWGYYFFQPISQYQEMMTFIHIRKSHHSYCFHCIPIILKIGLAYWITQIILYYLLYQSIPFNFIIMNGCIFIFSTLFVLFHSSHMKYSFIYYIMLLVGFHLFIW